MIPDSIRPGPDPIKDLTPPISKQAEQKGKASPFSDISSDMLGEIFSKLGKGDLGQIALSNQAMKKKVITYMTNKMNKEIEELKTVMPHILSELRKTHPEIATSYENDHQQPFTESTIYSPFYRVLEKEKELNTVKATLLPLLMALTEPELNELENSLNKQGLPTGVIRVAKAQQSLQKMVLNMREGTSVDPKKLGTILASYFAEGWDAEALKIIHHHHLTESFKSTDKDLIFSTIADVFIGTGNYPQARKMIKLISDMDQKFLISGKIKDHFTHRIDQYLTNKEYNKALDLARTYPVIKIKEIYTAKILAKQADLDLNPDMKLKTIIQKRIKQTLTGRVDYYISRLFGWRPFQ